MKAKQFEITIPMECLNWMRKGHKVVVWDEEVSATITIKYEAV